MNSCPLEGIRIVDLSRLLPGPFATKILGELGAEVIKVEDPAKPDYLRTAPPLKDGVNPFYAALNKGKKSVVLNYSHPKGAEVLRRVVQQADVLVESFVPEYLSQMGLGPSHLRQDNPELVYCSLTAYGASYPLPGHDLNFLALSGLGDCIRTRKGEPVIPSVQVADMIGSLVAVLAVLAALWERSRTGRGRFVDVSLTEATSMFTLLRRCRVAGEVGVEDLLSGECAGYRYYRCADGKWIAVAVIEEKFRRRLCEVLGCEDLVEALLDPGPRGQEANRRLEQIFSTREQSAWVDLLVPLEICVTPVLSPDEVSRRAFTLMGRISGQGFGLGIGELFGQDAVCGDGGSDGAYVGSRWGADTELVLGQLGFVAKEIAALKQSGIVGVS